MNNLNETQNKKMKETLDKIKAKGRITRKT